MKITVPTSATTLWTALGATSQATVG